MTDDAKGSSAAGPGGVRRRQSSHPDDDPGLVENADQRPGVREAIGVGRRMVSDPQQLVLSTSTAVDRPPLSGASSSPTPGPKVRFSEDRGRDSAVQPVPSASSSDGQQEAQHMQRSRPNGGPALSLDTGPSLSQSSILGRGVSTSPVAVSAPLSPRGAVSPPLLPSSGSKSQSRGFSLRRTLFSRPVSEELASGGSMIELGTPGSSQGTNSDQPSSHIENTKKSKGTTITVSATPDDNLDGLLLENASGSSALPHHEDCARRDLKHDSALGRLVGRGRKTILRTDEPPPSKDGRHVDLDPLRKEGLIDERYHRQHIDNTIRSSRYTLWNFFPRQLVAQFSKLANFYFLCVSILQMIPTLSTTGTYTTIIPLMIFVSISMAKEGYDDLRRYRLDKVENNKDAIILRASPPADSSSPSNDPAMSREEEEAQRWIPIKWHNLNVGDIVRLKRNEDVPADMVLLQASGPNGIAYIETMALDGETNLKSKQASPLLAKGCGSMQGMMNYRAHLVVEDPNVDLYKFEGKVSVSDDTQPLTNDQVIYRGSTLRNTQEAIGMIIYTGEECKIRMNATKNPRIKAPSLQARVNRIVIVLVAFVISLAVFNTAAYEVWSADTERKSWYLTNAKVPVFPVLASFVIIFNTLIPLSLYVSLEIIKLGQVFLMNDIDMYDEASDTPMEPRTSTINEELGQVSYIFSDKTGTLTNNSMRFRKLSVAGTAWLHDADIQRDMERQADIGFLQHKNRKGKKTATKRSMDVQSTGTSRLSDVSVASGHDVVEPHRNISIASRWRSTARPSRAQPELNTKALLDYIHRKPQTKFAEKTRFLLSSMALCHTCLPEVKDDGEIDYQAASPDELALVEAARELGYMLVDRPAGTITLKIFPAGPDGEPLFELYEILDVMEFSSARKRMSIIVRLPSNRICLLVKGADSTITRLLRSSRLAADKVNEVERQSNRRKSMEAQHAIRRRSTQVTRKSGETRDSLMLGRASVGGLSRRSTDATRFHPIRSQVDAWLTNREHEVDLSSLENVNVHSTPKPSFHFDPRDSIASGGRPTLRDTAICDGVVERALVEDEAWVFEQCFQHINDFATEGLRTLLYGYRYLDEQDYSKWKKIYLEATTSLTNRQALIERAGALVETDLELAGATAIEDRLQDGVPEAIDKLRRANIKLWMLTGDKRETAINIGHSCRLIKDYSSVTVLDLEMGDIERNIAATIVDINKGTVAHSVVVIDGQTLASIEESESLMALFASLVTIVDSVICCRASPAQKAHLVSVIRKKVKKSVTLAIGDGANDIAMIQEAHVGIGITGKEGLQAARTSDYSIAQFRFLLKLLLVHGRWNYVRTCKYTLSTFWKEMLFYLTQALYQRWAGYTGTSLYESASLSMFNTLFTSLPVIFIGIFERDLLASTLLAVPELYTRGQTGAEFNFKVYLRWVFMAACEAMMVFFIMLGLYGQAIFTKDNDLYALGVLTFTSCVSVIATKILFIEMHSKTIFALVGWVLSIGGWYLWNLILSAIYPSNRLYNVKGGLLHRFGDNLLWWLVLIIIVMSCIVFELGINSLRSAWFPTDVDIFQEYEHDLGLRKRFEEASATELQQGWRSKGKGPATQLEREREIEDLLDQPRLMKPGRPSDHLFRRRRSSEVNWAA